MVDEGVRVMSTAGYLTWSLLATLGAVGSGHLFEEAERYGAVAQAWLGALAFVLWSALAAVCLSGAV